MRTPPTGFRLAEALAALSLATDLGNGVPLETFLRHALIAARVAERAGLRPGERSAAFYTALLRSIGCTAFAHENAQLVGDDIAFQELRPPRPRAGDRPSRWASTSRGRRLRSRPRPHAPAAPADALRADRARGRGAAPHGARPDEQADRPRARRLVQRHLAHVYEKSGRRTRAGAALAMERGRSMADEELHLWTFDADGRVTAFRHYVDTAKQLEAIGIDLQVAA